MKRSPDRAFLLRLSAKLGVPDVDSLANSISPDQVLEWQAISVLDGWDDGYRQQSEILAAIHNATNRLEIANSNDPEAAFKQSKWKSGWDYIKDRFTFGKSKPKRSDGMMSPQQALKILEARSRGN